MKTCFSFQTSSRTMILLLGVFFGGLLCAQEVAKPCVDPGPMIVPSQKFNVKMKPVFLDQHPRLFFTKETLDEQLVKIKDPRMKPVVDNFLEAIGRQIKDQPPVNPPNTEDPFRKFGDILPRIAFAYLITSDEKYLSAAKNWFSAIIRYPSWAGDEDLGAGHICFGMAVAYDWLYQYLTPEERKSIETSLRMHARVLMRRSTHKPGSYWGDAYFQNHCWINHTGVAAVAAALYEKDPKEMQGWLDYTRSKFQPVYEDMGVDGAYHEGAMYASYGTQWILYYGELLRSVSGEDIFSGFKYLKEVGKFLIYNLMPDEKSYLNFGDCTPTVEWVVPEMYIKLASEYKDGRYLYLLRNSYKSIPQITYRSPFCILWADPNIEPKSYRDLPLMAVYPDSGLVISRTGWDENAAVVALHCSSPGGDLATKKWASIPSGTFGHFHPDANSFLFWADKQWRIAAPGAYTHLKLTKNENTWLVSGRGQRGEAKWLNASTYLGKEEQAHLVAVATSPQVDYMVGEAGSTYDENLNVTMFRRHIVFVKSPKPYLVVYDKLASKSPQTWEAFLHSYQPWQIDGNEFVIEEPGMAWGALFASDKIILKTHPLEVVAHPDSVKKNRGYEFVAQYQTPTTSPWLVTVIGLERGKSKVEFSGSGSAQTVPSVTVNQDKVSWDKNGNVIFNGKMIDTYIYQKE